MNFYVAIQIFLPISFMLQKIILYRLYLCYKRLCYKMIILRGMIQNKDIAVVKGGKESSVVIMKKSNYVN